MGLQCLLEACRSAAIQSQRQLGRAQIREQVRRDCGPTCALHDLDRIPQGTVKDPLLKEQEMIMGDANPP